MELITVQEIENINDKYYKNRDLTYYQEIINLIKVLENIDTTLELGPCKSPLVIGGDVVDITDEYLKDYPIKIGNFYKHDCSIVPFPFEEKKYDLVIACQVLEHLGTNQSEIFKELARISKMAIISLPYKWNKPCDVHHMIDEKIIDNWANGLKPIFQQLAKYRLIRIYNFEDYTSLSDIKKLQQIADFQILNKLKQEQQRNSILSKNLEQEKIQTKKIEQELNQKNKLIQEILGSNSWKYTESFRKLRLRFK